MNKVYVGNLPYSFTKNDLQEHFGEFGELTEVHIPTDRQTGRPRGFAFVTFASDNGARDAMNGLNGKSLGGRNVRVELVKPKEEDDRRRG